MAKWFRVVKAYYDAGYYDNESVRLFTRKGKLTPEEYEEITGEPYEP